jgi:hypothetical protein
MRAGSAELVAIWRSWKVYLPSGARKRDFSSCIRVINVSHHGVTGPPALTVG